MTLASKSRVVSLVVATFALNGSAWSAPAEPPAEAKPADSGILAGPKVEAEAETENDGRMNPQGQRVERREAEVPFFQWLNLVRQLELSDEQKPKVDAIAAEFRKAQEEFAESQGEEGRELFRAARKARQSGERLGPDQRQKLRAIEEGRPKPGAYQERIWAELTDAQQSELKIKLDEARERMMQRRAQPEMNDEPMNPGTDRRRRRSERDEPMTMEPAEPATEAAKGNEGNVRGESVRERRRMQNRGRGVTLDEMGQRRLKFLSSKQAANARGKHPAGEPTQAEREFEFDERE